MSDVQQRLTAALADRYRIERELGAGGMATVFLAADLRHDREVAIKVLHPDLGAALGSERFLAEIKTTAKLQHLHILPLLDSGVADGLLYYVMPFMRGETLRARLERSRPLSIAEALRIAREVASALDYAHRQGVVHRDIKPENILLQEGQAVVADFGIALAVQSAGGARMTQTGLSLGTPQYMAPEQAMGERTLDARADIYALGAVTYEMLSGEPPFSGSSVQAIVARVLNERPTPLTTLRDTVPPAIEQAVATALAKLPADRFESARAFADALGTGEGLTSGAQAAVPARRRGPGWPLAGTIAVGALAIGVALARWLPGAGATTADARSGLSQFTIEMRPGERIPFITTVPFNISPDGSTLVYSVLSFGRPNILVRRAVSSLDPAPVPGADPTSAVAFSPDGQRIAYTRARRLYVRRLVDDAEAPVTALTRRDGDSFAWLPDGRLAWINDSLRAIMTVPVTGGTPRVTVELPETGLNARIAPVPGRNAVLFAIVRPNADAVQIGWADLDAGTWDPVVVPDATTPLGIIADALVYTTGDGNLMAAPWDAKARRTTGSPQRLLGGIAVAGAGIAYASLSARGDLLYLDQSMRSQLLAVAPNGAVQPVLPETLDYRFPRLAPDGRRLVVGVFEGSPVKHNLYVVDLAERSRTRLDSDDAVPWRDRPEWSRDGRYVYYRTVQGATVGMGRRPADRSGGEERWTIPGALINEVAALPGDSIMVGRLNAAALGGQVIATWTLGDSTAQRLPGIAVGVGAPRVSPDGRWLAYVTTATLGSQHVFVTPFPGPGPQLQVDVAGTAAPVWGRDGRTLYYPDVDGIMAATLSLGATPAVVSRRRVLGLPLPLTSVHAPFDVGPDGTLYIVRPVREERLVLVRDLDVAIRNALEAARPE